MLAMWAVLCGESKWQDEHSSRRSAHLHNLHCCNWFKWPRTHSGWQESAWEHLTMLSSRFLWLAQHICWAPNIKYFLSPQTLIMSGRIFAFISMIKGYIKPLLKMFFFFFLLHMKQMKHADNSLNSHFVMSTFHSARLYLLEHFKTTTVVCNVLYMEQKKKQKRVIQ